VPPQPTQSRNPAPAPQQWQHADSARYPQQPPQPGNPGPAPQ
jgi:hypothetical protein